MKVQSKPLFIVGCGRSGTQALARMFDSCAGVTMHHEYMVHHTQPLGVMKYHNLRNGAEVRNQLKAIYSGAIHFCTDKIWGDSSNKVSWFIDELTQIFPDARFIHIVRDGRKVTSSLYNKLGAECLDDVSTEIMKHYISNYTSGAVMPPFEKQYWWPVALKEEDETVQYSKLDQFGRIAFHWAQINSYIGHVAQSLESSQFQTFKLEDVTTDRAEFERMMDFSDIEPRDEQFEMMQRPHNVVRPENNPLSEDQLSVFWSLCRETMKKYGYDGTEEYELEYNPGRSIRVI